MSDWTLRPATDADHAWLRAMKELTMRPYVEQTWGRWEAAVQDEHFRRGYASGDWQVIVAKGADAGLLSVQRRADEIFLGLIEIHPRHQRQGLGTRILRQLQSEAAASARPLRLRVLRVNPARRLYERLGFTVTGESATHTMMEWRAPAPTPG